MRVDLSKVKVGDRIFTISNGLEVVLSTNYKKDYPIETNSGFYTFEGKASKRDKYPSAFLEYPFKEQEIEKDTLVWFRDNKYESWKVGYYSRFKDGQHWCFMDSKKSTETKSSATWNVVTTENPFV